MKRPSSQASGPALVNVNRRRFLHTASAATALAALPAWGADALDVVNGKPKRVGLIGCGWYGKSDLWRLMQVTPVEVISLCDPDAKLLSEAADMATARQRSGKTPRTYKDYRQMLQEKELDIVIVGSPDHWHALHTIGAIEAGADVYCQKPISRDVREGEAMLDAARKRGRVVQVGTQRKSTPHLIDVKQQIIEAGKLGKIGHVEMCCYYPMRANGDPPLQAVPEHLDYELWTGPAPLRPYDGSPHLRWWRTFNEYGNGILGDMCVHMLDTVRWMLNLRWPRTVSSVGGIFVQKGGKSNIPDTQTATFAFDEFNAVWQHRSWGPPVDPDYPWGLFIHGEKGVLKASTMRADFIPADKAQKPIHFDCLYEKERFPEDVKEKDIELNAAPATRKHMVDFLAAIATRGRPVADIEEGHISTASCILANVAMDVGRTLSYDPKRRLVAGDKEATQKLLRPYRKPWKHPALSRLTTVLLLVGWVLAARPADAQTGCRLESRTTKGLQAAIDACSKQGGGKVVVPPGWGSAEVFKFVLRKRTPESPLGAIENITATGAQGTARGTSLVEGHAERPIKNVSIEGLDVRMLPENKPDKRTTDALVFRRVENLKLDRVSVQWDQSAPEPKWKSALVIDSVRGLRLNDFTANPSRPGVPTIVRRNVK